MDERALEREQVGLARAEPPPWRPERPPRAVAACFVCFPRGESGRGAAGDPCWAGAALLRDGRLAAAVALDGRAGAPYEPGLLALRELPLLEAAVRRLPAAAEVLLVNATSRDHPRGAGLALHLGAVLDLPTVGVTHRPLIAEGAWPDDEARAATSPLRLGGQVVAAWLRTRARSRPLAVHPGWRVDLETAIAVVLAGAVRARTPEPLRQARRTARLARARAVRATAGEAPP